jgi:hypothetical protein
MEADIFVPFVFFAFLASVILVPVLAKERTKRSAHTLITHALDRGQAVDPQLVSQLTNDMLQEGNRARKSLGNGVILLALAGGLLAAGYLAGDFNGHFEHGMAVPAVILGAVGAAFLLLAIIDYATKNKTAA